MDFFFYSQLFFFSFQQLQYVTDNIYVFLLNIAQGITQEFLLLNVSICLSSSLSLS